MELPKLVIRTILIVLFIVSILFTIRFCSRFVSHPSDKGVTGDGNVIRKEVSAAPFSSLEISGSVNVYIRQADNQKIEIIADSNLIQFIEISNDEEILIIRQRRNLHLSKPAKVLISTPYLSAIELEGAAEINITDTLRTDNFRLEIEGAAMARLLLECRYVTAKISGAGEIEIGGRAEKAKTTIKGAGRLSAKQFIVGEHEVTVDGVGNAYVHATDILTATLKGAGMIEYSGNPQVIPTIKGVGKIRPASK